MTQLKKKILTVRTPSGLSGDMLLCGLLRMAEVDDQWLNTLIDQTGIPELNGSITIKAASVNGISGWRVQTSFPPQPGKCHYGLIKKRIAESALRPVAKGCAEAAFARLAEAEAAVHAIPISEVTFHEVGALDSLLDICLSAALFENIAPARFVCSPLPLCDGIIDCRHGSLSSPAPAVLNLLKGVPVYGVDSNGETVTPTAVTLLKAFGAVFGPWPEMVIDAVAHVYGGRVLPNIPNGAIFALGTAPFKSSSTDVEKQD
ncbi:MAG: nickel insertion protein [Nitrospiria bacterium]